ncbi:TPA: relaxase/mobilization nuclease domain-containing protein, partial [Acinetobacter baumannii]|nr:relaxase/mobilization nuclease domain-containing protein [Acinetobacter baumannii]
MYIKFLKHGQGSPSKAAGYLVDEKDHLDRPRQDVQVLCGDPQTFTAIAESIQNEWKYTSGVIAWSKSDNPTDEQIKEVLEAFERHAFAGLEPSQYHMTAVLHEEDDGSKHVHFLVPRVELETGKALNIAPPNHQKYYDPLRDHFNYKNGWDRPDGIALQRDTQQPNHEHFIDKAAIRAGLKDRPVKDVRELVGDFLEQRIEHGFIRNRSDVVDALKELGEVTRQGKDYISLKIDEESKAIRLKGAFYEQEFSIKSYIEDRARTANDAGTSREFRAVSADHQKRAEQCREEFTRLATKRSEYNAERYQRPERDNTGLELNQEREQHNSQSYQRGGQDSTNSVKPTEAEFTAFDGGLRGLERQEQRSRQDDQN